MTVPKPLVETTTIGSLKIHAIQAGGQLLDGGAMFGVVPKALWQRRIPADDRNRIQLGMRCLLVEHDNGLILIDTGSGNKETPKFQDIYGIENEGRNGRTALEDGIAELGFRPEDVAFVIDSHLHFDHAGGNTFTDSDGGEKFSFPNARYIVQAGEYDAAVNSNERTAASYFPRNYVPIYEAGKFDLIDGDREIMKGVRLIQTPGHTRFHQSVVLESNGQTGIFLGDIVPTHAHLPLPWIMGYDLEPLVSLETKRKLLATVVEEDWTVFFPHDATISWGKVYHDGKSYALKESEE